MTSLYPSVAALQTGAQRVHRLVDVVEIRHREAVSQARRMFAEPLAQHAGVAGVPVPVDDEAVLLLEARVPGDGLVTADRTWQIEIDDAARLRFTGYPPGRPSGPGTWPRHGSPAARARIKGTPLAPEISMAGSGSQPDGAEAPRTHPRPPRHR